MQEINILSAETEALKLINNHYPSIEDVEIILGNNKFPDEINNIILKYQQAKIHLRNSIISSYEFGCFSLGERCKTANLIARWGLNSSNYNINSKSNLFDLGDFPFTSLCALFSSNLDEIYNPSLITSFDPTRKKGNTDYVIHFYNNKYKFRFNHDFIYLYKDKYQFCSMIKSRVEKFKDILLHGNNLFIHITPFHKYHLLPEFIGKLDLGKSNILLYCDTSNAKFDKISHNIYKIGLGDICEDFPLALNKPDYIVSEESFNIEKEICSLAAEIIKNEFPKRSENLSVDTIINNINSIHEDQIKNSPVLKNFIQYSQSFMDGSQNNGAIVMNCNPFTNGHLFLIDYAAKKVEKLFIFVVEEDKSYFKFNDRLKLVKDGCKHLKNVIVLPSSRFIISTATFPDYFNKDDHSAPTHFDASKDLDFFCKYIATPLKIKTRFFGSEPICQVTGAYNNQALTILPSYGIKTEIIPRFEINGEVVSASIVRKYLKERELEKIIPLVPSVTWNFIKKQIKNGALAIK